MNKEKLKAFEANLKNMITELKSSEYDKSKKINLLFGSGINFHIASNPLSWSDLTQKSLFNYFSETKKYDNFTNRASANELSKFINNKKISLAISEEHIKLKFKVVWNKFTHKFKNNLEMIMERFQTFILTLNYDQSIEKIINKESINLLEGHQKESSKVNHMHGIISKNGLIKGKKMLTINDYVENYDDSRKAFRKLFFKEVEEKFPEYVFIFGTSMKEEHILSAFKNSINNKIIIIYFIYFIYFLDDKDIFERIKITYEKMNIKIVNYNFQDDPTKQSEDFKEAWKIFSKLLLEWSSSGHFLGENFSSYEDWSNLEKDDDLTKNAKFMNLSNDQKKETLIVMKRLGKISTSKYLSYYDLVPNIINQNVYFDPKELKEEILLEFMEKIEKKIIFKPIIDFEAKDNFSSEMDFIYQMLDQKELNKYYEGSNFCKIATYRIIDYLQERISSKQKIPKEAFNNPNLDYEQIGNQVDDFGQMPNSLSSKLFNDFFNKKISEFPQFQKYATPNWGTLENLMTDKNIRSSWRTAIWLTEQWSDFIKREKIKIFTTFENEKNLQRKYRWFLLIYLIFIETNKKEVIEIVSRQNEIREYPTTLYYIGHSGFSPKINELDGKFIAAKDKSIYFNNIDEFLGELEKIKKIENSFELGSAKHNLWTRIDKININTTKNKIDFIKKVDEVFKDEYLLWRVKIDGIKNNNFKYLSNDINEYVEMKKELESTSNAIKIIKLDLDEKIKKDFLAQKESELLRDKISSDDAYNLAFLKLDNISYHKAYHIGYDWYKKLIDLNDKKIMKLLEKNLRDSNLFTENQLDFIFKRNKTLAIETINDFYIRTTFLNNVGDVDWKKMIDLLKGELKIGGENILIEFYKFYFYKKYKKINNLKLKEKLEFLIKSEKSANEKNNLLKTFITELKIYFLLRCWNNLLPHSIGNLELKQLILLISGFKDYKKDKLSDKIMSQLFNRASGQEESIFNSFSIISDFHAGKKTKLAIKKKIETWLQTKKDEHYYLEGLKKFVKKWKIEFNDKINKMLNKKRQ